MRLRIKGENVTYKVFSVFNLPGASLTLELTDKSTNKHLAIKGFQQNTIDALHRKWSKEVPEKPGLYHLVISDPQSTDSVMVNVFVMVPFKKVNQGILNGYKIGNYPSIPLRQLSIYKPPAGFVEVTEQNMDTYVSPHFQLKQFLCKQESNFPKYLVLNNKLLLKLELILEKVNEKGYHAPTFHIMSGYRTPYYNKLIGNVKYSRHIYGGAADIFIDENPQDGMMDDLNRDGKVNFLDAGILYDIIDSMYGHPWYEIFRGGLGRYRKTSDHGPFVHIDVRGFRARWGD